MEGTFSFSKDFSEIPGLQGAYHLRYTAQQEEEGARLEVCCESSLGSRRESCLLKGAALGKAKQLAQYLYENAAQPGQWQDILRDEGWNLS